MNIKRAIAAFALLACGYGMAAQYEAESATLSGTANVVEDANASGGKAVDEQEGDISFKVSVETAGKYLVKIHYKAGSEKTNYIDVNGDRAGELYFAPSTKYTDATTIVTLKAGENTIAITKFWGWITVDYIDVSAYESQAFAICNAPVNEKASAEAVKLYNFLVNNFGKKTISGIMTGDMDGFTEGADFKTHADVADVYTRSGKYPALVGVDLMNATGGSANQDWFKGYTNKAISIAKGVWKAGGIPAITWHWRPGNEEEFYTASGNDKSYTTFDLSKAFMTGGVVWDTLSAEYKTIVSDIDKISTIFLDLQKENVAAIFRPLHEAGGNWFWWGAKDAKQLAALYRLLYERMVTKNGVNNLVWVFNPSTTSGTEWNPGEAYYDVLSIDIYNKDNDHSSNAGAFDDFKTKWGVSKVLALSENGPIPDVEKMVADQAIWSWWMSWYGTWGSTYPAQTSNDVWKTNMSDDRIVTLDEMPGWDKYTEANSGTATCKAEKIETKYNGDADKANGNKQEGKMEVTYALGKDGALINYTKLPDLTKAKSISVEISVNGSGAVEDGVWFGLAFVRNGMTDSAWTWEQSTSDGCWLSQKESKTCKFDITIYKDEDGAEHPIDIDNLFSVVFVASGEGFNGTVTFDNLIADDGSIISTFDEEKSLFAVSEGSETTVKSIKLVSATTAIKDVAKASAAKFSIEGRSVNLTTAKAGIVSVDVFGMNGRRVATLYKGNLNAGNYAFSLADLSAGQYIVRVKGAGLMATQPVRIK